jgi:ABC-type lipoprotein release transport system permease subunit
MLFRYAWKGFLRRRTRTSLSVAGIALSVGLLVAVLSISNSVQQAVSASLGAAGADMVVQQRVKPCPFSPVKLPKDLGAMPGTLVHKIESLKQVEAASGVLMLWAFWQGHPTVIAGVDPTKKTIGPVRISQKEANSKDEKSCCAVMKGRYLVRYDDYHVMLTEDYARAIGADVGSHIHLGPKDTFTVVGLLKLSGSARIAEAEAFVPLATAQKMYGQGDVVDTIFVALKGVAAIPLVSEVIRQWTNPGISLTTSENVDAATSAVANVTRRSMLGISALVLFFALLLIVRNAVATVTERLAEVGLMRAIGWRRGEVGRLFVSEELLAGVFGGLLGCLIGWLLAFGFSQVADLKLPSALSSFPPCSTTQPPLALPLATMPSPPVFLAGLGVAIIIGTIAGLTASRRAARLDPAVALRRL